MTEALGPHALRELAAHLEVEEAGRDALLAQADAWERERSALEQELAAVRAKLDLLEKDREWWKANVIKRRRRAEERRAGGRPEEKRR